jgi:hypothetical protein
LRLYQLATWAEQVIAKACELEWQGDRAKNVEVDDASLVAREQVIASLGKGQTLLFPVRGYVVQVVGAKHMLVEWTGLPVEAIEAKARAGHSDAQRIYHELTEMSGVVVRRAHARYDGASFVIEFPSGFVHALRR